MFHTYFVPRRSLAHLNGEDGRGSLEQRGNDATVDLHDCWMAMETSGTGEK